MLVVGVWDAVCGNNWDVRDAHVVCRQLGFSGALDSYVITNNDGSSVRLSDVRCEGQEASLADCSCQIIDAGNYCGIGKYAGARCQGMSFIFNKR